VFKLDSIVFNPGAILFKGLLTATRRRAGHTDSGAGCRIRPRYLYL